MGINIKTVPYRSASVAGNKLIAGEIDIALIPIDVIERLNQSRANAPRFAPILTQPFQFEKTREIFEIQRSPLGDAVLADVSRAKLIALGYWNRGQTNILSNARILTAGDFKGLKIRSPQQRAGDEVLLALGASPITLAFAEVQQALMAGAMDAVEISPTASVEYVQLVGERGTLVSGYRPLVGILAANENSWLRLTEREKGALVRVSRIAAAQGNAEVLLVEQNLENVVKEYGVRPANFNKADLEMLSNASKEAWTQYREGRALAAINGLQEMKRLAVTARTRPAPEILGAPAPKNTPPVLFVTNRPDEGGNELKDRFGSRKKGVKLTCGELSYSPAANRQIGDAFDGDLALTPEGTKSGEDICLDFIGAQVSKLESRRVLFFIHGFNNTFEEAVKRAITTAIDIEYDGLVVVWSWPSEGHVYTYGKDAESVRGSGPYLVPFVKKLVQRREIKRADFLFHSMGNRLGLSVMKKLSTMGKVSPSLGLFIFAAPDEARDIFDESIDRTPNFKSQRTLYAAKCDRPLWISQIIHFSSRAGTGGHENILLNKGMESVDVTDVETSCWWTLANHSYVFDTPEVINDLKLLLKKGQSAANRNFSVRYRDGLPYKVLNEN